MHDPGETAFRITGVQTDGSGVVCLVEIEVLAGQRRLAFGQSGASPNGLPALHGVSLDGLPFAVVSEEPPGFVGLGLEPMPERLPGIATSSTGVDEADIVAHLAPWLGHFTEGLYSIRRQVLPVPCIIGHDFVEGSGPVVFDHATWASDEGAGLVAELSPEVYLLLTGRDALRRGDPAFVVSGGFVIEAPGFEARHHDRGAREAFARTHQHVWPDRVLRDAVANHRAVFPEARLGPLDEDTLEPAATKARALVASVREKLGVDENGRRLSTLFGTEFRFPLVVARGAAWLVLLSLDGQDLHEAQILVGERVQLAGVRPSLRAILRALRQVDGISVAQNPSA